jgi:hypothetical protein
MGYYPDDLTDPAVIASRETTAHILRQKARIDHLLSVILDAEKALMDAKVPKSEVIYEKIRVARKLSGDLLMPR